MMIFCRSTYQEGAKIRKRNTGIIAVKHGCAIASLIGAVLELGRVGAINERLIRVVVKVELADGDVRLYAYCGQRKRSREGAFNRCALTAQLSDRSFTSKDSEPFLPWHCWESM